MVRGPDRNSDDRRLGVDLDDDRWLERIRDAERPLVMGRSGRYELLTEVSRGGQGIVYRARDVRNGRIVAVKRLVAGSLASLPTRQRFERELETAAALDHPNIVRVYGFEGGGGGQPLLAMQWIDGTPITEWVMPEDREPRSQREILELFVKVCDAVHHAHQRGVIHRDLKPSNILVDAADEPHLLDFGLAKLQPGLNGSDSGVTLTGQFLGTPAFASPEQVRGGPTAVDVRSDVYSLSVVLYRVLTGTMPYPVDGSLADVFQSIEHADPRAPSSVAAIDRELDADLLKALSKHPRDRYQSANRLGTDLIRYLHGEVLEAKADGRLYVLGKTLRRYRVAVSVATLCLVVLVDFSATMSVMYSRAEREAENARQVRQFLLEMLASASPYRTGDSSIDLDDMLQRTAGRIETDLAGQPAAQAGVHFTIARIYAGLWKWKDAEPHLRIALMQYRQLYGNEHPEVASCLTLLGRSLTFQGRAGAIAAQRRALDIRRRYFGPDDLLTAETHGNLGFAIWKTSHPPDREASERNYRRALDLFGKSDEGPSADWARITYSYGMFQFDGGQFADALELLETAMGMYRALSGSGDVYMNNVLEAYARSLRVAGRFDEAVAALEESLRLRPPGVADDHVVRLRWSLGQIHHLLGEYGRELDEYDKALAMRCEMLDSSTSRQTAWLAAQALHLRDHAHDAEFYGNVFTALATVEPVNLVLHRMADVAGSLQAIRGQRAVNSLIDRAVEIASRVDGGGEMSVPVALARNTLGARLVELDRLEEAEYQLLSSYSVLRHVRGEAWPWTRAATVNLLKLYEAWDRPDEAQVYSARLRGLARP